MTQSHVRFQAPCYVLLFLLFSLARTQAVPSPYTSPCPVVLPISRIVGGTFMNASFMVSFSTRTRGHVCSGVMIASTKILTVNHCGVTSFHVARISSTNGIDGIEIPILFTESHPTDDIAVITLSRPANVEPVSLLTNSSLPRPWSFVRAMGYGYHSYYPFPSDNRLKFVDIPIISSSLCELLWDRISSSMPPGFPEGWICAGYLESASCSPCQGDGGGPLLSSLDDAPVIVGVIARGKYCRAPDLPDQFVRVSSIVSWLKGLGVDYKGVSKLDEAFVDNRNPRTPIAAVESEEVRLSGGAITGVVLASIAVTLVAVLLVVHVVRASGKSSNANRNVGES